jgi:hypothetical protein
LVCLICSNKSRASPPACLSRFSFSICFIHSRPWPDLKNF